MLFDTPIFFVFLVTVVSIYWKLGRRGQNYFLLAASYFFYGWWDWRFLFLMGSSTLVDFVIAKRIGRTTDPKGRKILLTASLVLNFGFLCYFKYLHFFLDSFSRLVSLLGIHNIPVVVMQVILPPAISFYTFQEVAYIVDVYKGRIEPADSLVDYALFISLFPHLIAGPIQRPSHLLPQVQKPRVFRPGFFFSGCLLIISGLFRKCVVADSCAILANAAFDGKMGTGWAVPLIGMWAFGIQIYGDFSGYSDIARGAAQLMGFHFMVNFRQPYLATSLQEFWRRWHISLSSWLRDYLYIPLGGNRKGERRTYVNLLTTMLLGGLWHGANWTFVIWGFLHGAALAVERAVSNARREIAPANTFQIWLRRAVVFNFACFAFLIFRAASWGDAIRLLGNLLHWAAPLDFLPAFFFLGFYAFLILSMDLVLERSGGEYVTENLSPRLQIAGAVAGLLMIAFLSTGGTSAFIYFQF